MALAYLVTPTASYTSPVVLTTANTLKVAENGTGGAIITITNPTGQAISATNINVSESPSAIMGMMNA